ncbi:MAG: alpha/beta fold hydrolase [Nitriliruptoraceae bacterium]
MPVTVWHGAEDRVCPLGPAERLAARIPGAILHQVAGEGHLVPIEHWHEILATG